MTCDLESVRCDAELHRVGFAPNPWTFTDWRFAEKGRFRGRWDDPAGEYPGAVRGLHGVRCRP